MPREEGKGYQQERLWCREDLERSHEVSQISELKGSVCLHMSDTALLGSNEEDDG